jgi:hypothetical protein
VQEQPLRLTDLPDEQLNELIGLFKRSDTVELKMTVPESEQRAALSALALDPLDAEIRQVFFFDTPDLSLNRAGVVARARRVQGKLGDTVVKLRPVEPDHLPKRMRNSQSLGVEVDAMPGGTYVCSASMKRRLENAEVREAASGGRPLRKLFSKEQRDFFAAHAPEGIGLDDLAVLGPIFVLKLKWVPERYARRSVAELWMYPDSTRILELSTKCAPSEALQVAVESRAFLADQGITVSGEQQTKTKTALEYYSTRAQEDLPGGGGEKETA